MNTRLCWSVVSFGVLTNRYKYNLVGLYIFNRCFELTGIVRVKLIFWKGGYEEHFLSVWVARKLILAKVLFQIFGEQGHIFGLFGYIRHNCSFSFLCNK